MNYLMIGKMGIINDEIKKIIKENHISSDSISQYDLEESSISLAIEDLNTYNLFEGIKLVIVNNINKIDNEEILLKYLNNSSSNILVLTSWESLDERKKLTKEIKKTCKSLDFTDFDLFKMIKDRLQGYEINMKAINTLKEYCNDNYDVILNSIDKLKLYKKDTLVITEEDIKKIIKKSFDSNIFDLINAINKKDKMKLFNVYYELKYNNVDDLQIISVLANHFKLIYKIKELNGLKDQEIISNLKLHPYRFKLLKSDSYQYEKKELLKFIKNLSIVDINIKSGKLSKDMAMELFLSKL